MVKEFNMDFLDIPLVHFPEVGGIMVCHDPQNRLKTYNVDITWAVLKVSSTNFMPEPLGLFWDKKFALIFAQALED